MGNITMKSAMRRARLAGTASLVAGLAALPLAARADAPQAQAQAAADAAPTDIVVTARKRSESVATVPIAITAFSAKSLEAKNIETFDDYATKVPNLSFSYGGGPTGISSARTIAIRGITGQNLAGTAGATGFYIDDTPVPGSLDPRVLDIESIEVLKGPQGTLFGESSLGGNVRLITKKPDLVTNSASMTADIGATEHGGSPDGGVSGVGNLVLVPDRLALRVVAFYDHEAGYLKRTYVTDPAGEATYDPFNTTAPRTTVGNQGAVSSYGGSATLRWAATEDLDIQARVMAQSTSDNGFQAAFAPLPNFTPDYTLDRAFNVQPTASDRWITPSLDVKYKGQGWSFVSSNSYFYRKTNDYEDSTYGTQQALYSFYGLSTGTAAGDLKAQPYIWHGVHTQKQFVSENRLSFDPIHGISGTIGVYYSHVSYDFSIPDTYAAGLGALTGWTENGQPSDLIWTQNGPGSQDDVSIFGELYWKFLDHFTLTLGGRAYWLKQHADYTADGYMNDGVTPSSPTANSESGFNPKVELAWQATRDLMLYGSASKGFRAGGAQPLLSFCSLPNGVPDSVITDLKSDTLWSYEGGAKLQLRDPGILITADAFHIDWSNIQQQVALDCGAYFDVNGNKARINGGELEMSGKLTRYWSFNLGFGYEHTALTDPGNMALLAPGITPGQRISGTPDVTLTLGSDYRAPIGHGMEGFIGADYSYTGNETRILNGGSGTLATSPSYNLVNARIGVAWAKTELSLNANNLTGARPNLGDIGYVGYAQFSAGGSVIPQVATMPPMTVTIKFKQSF
jgi:iron complex outermembrane recepter protein